MMKRAPADGSRLLVYMPATLNAAVATAASRRMTSASGYARTAILEKLKDDGELEEIDSSRRG